MPMGSWTAVSTGVSGRTGGLECGWLPSSVSKDLVTSVTAVPASARQLPGGHRMSLAGTGLCWAGAGEEGPSEPGEAGLAQ